MILELTTILKDLGLSDKEIAVYSTILPMGSASIRILEKKTGINRGSVYDALESLAEKGFIAVEKKGLRRKFIVKSPEELLSSIEKKQRNLESQKRKIEREMPKLLSFYAKQGGRPSVEYFDDDEGIKKILEDVLLNLKAKFCKKKEYYVYSSKSVRRYLYKLFPNFTREKIMAGVKTKVIALGEGGDPKNLKLAERKWMQTDAPAYILIYGSKTALISVAEDEKPFGVIINDPKIAETQKIIFEELFKKLK
jgi:sugar-specific transcriptional regulator TrmB